MNKIVIIGRLTKDVELKAANSGTELCNFTVAVDRRAKKGEEKQCDFIDCTAWSKTAAFISTYFHRGDGITIEGRMESRKWQDKDGNNRVSWGVTVETVEFPVGGKSSEKASTERAFPAQSEMTEMTETDDLPF